MSRRNLLIISIIAGLIAIAGIVYFVVSKSNPEPAGQNGSGQNQDPTNNQPMSPINNTGLPLTLPPGFAISNFADSLPGARVMVFDGQGNMWVSQTSEGTVSQLEIRNGQVTNQHIVFQNLNNPHGLAVDPQNPLILYIAEEHRISKIQLYSDAPLQKIADLPDGGGHFTRTIAFGPDDRLYVSIGSSCNVCNEQDERRASIYSMNKDGSDFRVHSRGLRNAVFFTWSYVDGRMWATEMGRDNLGDNVPPDEINIIMGPSTSSGQNSAVPNFGWPICYGKNIHDTNFDKNTYIQDPCNDKIPSVIDLQAHSAPLGLAFVPEEGWPEGYWYDLIVAFHGSWNRSEPTGYKLVRVRLDAKGNFQGQEDFISGWLSGGNVLGRPVDILIQPGGVMYVTDDKAGVIYQVKYIPASSINSFEECTAAGFPVMESYPRQCREPGGETHVEDIGNKLNKTDLIKITDPRPNALVTSPLRIAGEARGFWFFEASFPVKLLDETGKEIASWYATAQGEWMTEDFVSFETKLEFSAPATNKGTLILQKDNPSGLPEHDDELRIPVRFR